ncbi:MAG: hypothetical protein D3916_06015, partial [Candidatus Electrothrix sp. MAN1_4]|nr:hypothetical protein [Candidatus Electrothrix sp. MAN1_4]
MSTVQWRPVINALTKPVSYRIQIVPRGIVGYDEMAVEISTEHPNYNEDLVRSLAPLIMEWTQNQMINGNQVTLPDAFIFRVSAQGRLNSPDAALPDNEDMLQVSISGSRDFLRRLREAARMERLPMNEKLPHINSAQDTKLKLDNVLNPTGLLLLNGSNLFFDEVNGDGECVLQGTRSGSTVQLQYAAISNSEILLVPDIPAQDDPWNNEYTVSVTTQYTEHGTPRSGTYRRCLRTPLTVTLGGDGGGTDTGILTGSAETPYVTITEAQTTAPERLRIQAIFDLRTEQLLISLLNMQRKGEAGPAVAVTANGDYSLSG